VKLGLDTYSYRHAAGLWDYVPRENPAMGVDHLLQKAADLDLDGVQLADARHLDSLDYGYVSQLRRKGEDLGLYLELGTGGTNPEHLESMVRTAHVLASPVVRTFVGRPRGTTPQEMENLLSQAASEIRQVLPVCDRYGIPIAIENHQDLTTDELLGLLELIDSQWVGVCFDTGNPLALLEDPVESARAFGPLVRTVHLKDYQVAARSNGFCLIGCALGDGVVDLRAVLEALSREAPEANLNIEAYIGKHAVPALDDEYLRRIPEVSALALGRTLRLVRDRGLRREPPLLTDRGAPEAEVLAAEEQLVARSARWARQALKRPAPEAEGEDE
jgi:sugar phosphate isomerase/epimerase